MAATRFTDLVACSMLVQQAGVTALAPPELAVAVSEAGGLGMLGTTRGRLSPATLSMMLDRLHEMTT